MEDSTWRTREGFGGPEEVVTEAPTQRYDSPAGSEYIPQPTQAEAGHIKTAGGGVAGGVSPVEAAKNVALSALEQIQQVAASAKAYVAGEHQQGSQEPIDTYNTQPEATKPGLLQQAKEYVTGAPTQATSEPSRDTAGMQTGEAQPGLLQKAKEYIAGTTQQAKDYVTGTNPASTDTPADYSQTQPTSTDDDNAVARGYGTTAGSGMPTGDTTSKNVDLNTSGTIPMGTDAASAARDYSTIAGQPGSGAPPDFTSSQIGRDSGYPSGVTNVRDISFTPTEPVPQTDRGMGYTDQGYQPSLGQSTLGGGTVDDAGLAQRDINVPVAPIPPMVHVRDHTVTTGDDQIQVRVHPVVIQSDTPVVPTTTQDPTSMGAAPVAYSGASHVSGAPAAPYDVLEGGKVVPRDTGILGHDMTAPSAFGGVPAHDKNLVADDRSGMGGVQQPAVGSALEPGAVGGYGATPVDVSQYREQDPIREGYLGDKTKLGAAALGAGALGAYGGHELADRDNSSYNTGATSTSEKPGLLDKVKEMLPGQHHTQQESAVGSSLEPGAVGGYGATPVAASTYRAQDPNMQGYMGAPVTVSGGHEPYEVATDPHQQEHDKAKLGAAALGAGALGAYAGHELTDRDNTGYNTGAAATSEKPGMLDKVKQMLPGHHTQQTATTEPDYTSSTAYRGREGAAALGAGGLGAYAGHELTDTDNTGSVTGAEKPGMFTKVKDMLTGHHTTQPSTEKDIPYDTTDRSHDGAKYGAAALGGGALGAVAGDQLAKDQTSTQYTSDPYAATGEHFTTTDPAGSTFSSSNPYATSETPITSSTAQPVQQHEGAKLGAATLGAGALGAAAGHHLGQDNRTSEIMPESTQDTRGIIPEGLAETGLVAGPDGAALTAGAGLPQYEAAKPTVPEEAGSLVPEILPVTHRTPAQTLVLEVTEANGLELGSLVTVKSGAPTPGWRTQWSRVMADGTVHILDGADGPAYAPEPNDVGSILRADVATPDGPTFVISAQEPVRFSATVEADVARLATNLNGSSFPVNLLEVNLVPEQDLLAEHVLEVLPEGIRLSKAGMTIMQDPYSNAMLLCGMRSSAEDATRCVFIRMNATLAAVLKFNSAAERNAALMYIRTLGKNAGVVIKDPTTLYNKLDTRHAHLAVPPSNSPTTSPASASGPSSTSLWHFGQPTGAYVVPGSERTVVGPSIMDPPGTRYDSQGISTKSEY